MGASVVGIKGDWADDPELDADLVAAQKEAEERAALEGMSLEAVIREGHKALFVGLVAKQKAGTASHQEMAILRNLLRDNGMYLGVAPEGAEDSVKAKPVDLPSFKPGDQYD